MKMFCTLMLLGVSGLALAQEPVPSADPETETRRLLQFQRSGAGATDVVDELTPTGAANAQRRMEDAFSHSIPEHLIEADFAEED